MNMVRRIIGVLVGYIVFAASAVLLFRLAGRNPHAQQDVGFMVAAIVYGVFFGALGGYLSAVIGGGRPRTQGIWVGVIIALGATVSLLAGPKAGSAWSRVAALFLMAPAAVVGGMIRGRTR